MIKICYSHTSLSFIGKFI